MNKEPIYYKFIKENDPNLPILNLSEEEILKLNETKKILKQFEDGESEEHNNNNN